MSPNSSTLCSNLNLVLADLSTSCSKLNLTSLPLPMLCSNENLMKPALSCFFPLLATRLWARWSASGILMGDCCWPMVQVPATYVQSVRAKAEQFAFASKQGAWTLRWRGVSCRGEQQTQGALVQQRAELAQCSMMFIECFDCRSGLTGVTLLYVCKPAVSDGATKSAAGTVAECQHASVQSIDGLHSGAESAPALVQQSALTCPAVVTEVSLR